MRRTDARSSPPGKGRSMKRTLAALVLALALCLLGGCGQRTPPYLEVNGREIASPSLRDLESGLRNLSDGEDSYVYLELSQPLDGLWYLSAALPLAGYEDGLGYIVEACAADGEGYAYYECRTTDQEQLLDWFREFFRGRSAPDISGWEDVTDWYGGDGYDYHYDYDPDYDGVVRI